MMQSEYDFSSNNMQFFFDKCELLVRLALVKYTYIYLNITDSDHFHKHQKLDPEKANAETTDPGVFKTNKVSKL